MAGLLVASVSFVLLTAAVGTSQARLQGSVRTNFRPAYDMLVRPSGAEPQPERQRSLVPDNFGSGLFGGISLTQYHRVQRLAGVEVAAPVANIGYVMPTVTVEIPVDAYLDKAQVQLFRVRADDVSQRGLSTYPAGDSYVYYTRANRFTYANSAGLVMEQTPRGPVDVCEGGIKAAQQRGSPTSPFENDLPGVSCFSARTPNVRHVDGTISKGAVGVAIARRYPLLLSAIDPVQEARLLGLDHSIASGRYLQAADMVTQAHNVPVFGHVPVVPVIANNQTYLDDTLRLQIQRLTIPNAAQVSTTLASARAPAYLAGLPGHTVAREQRSAASDYPGVLAGYAHHPPSVVLGDFSEYRQAGSITYRRADDGLVAEPVENPNSVWFSKFADGFLPVPQANADTALRHLSAVQGTNLNNPDGSPLTPTVQIVGQFDPNKLPGYSPLSRVPLETYFPPQVSGADARSRSALHDQALRPDANLAGYLTQPPAMLTTLAAASASFWNSKIYSNAPKAPVSYIRVRVAGVTGPDKVSLARINAVAAEIHKSTGLTVDITAGSSPAPQTISLPGGKFGRPSLKVTEGWVAKGVSVRFLHAADEKSLLLFALVLVVCLLFLGNAALAAERARRTDLGTLSCLGWSRRALFRFVLSEQAVVGLVAGVVGTGLAALLVGVLGLQVEGWRLGLITPVAVVLACVAGLQAALRAARASPLDAVAVPVATLRRVRRVRSVARLAAANVRRFPGRSLAGAAALFVSVAALTIVVGVTIAYRGVLVGTLLGNAISVQVRGVDYLAVALTLLLGALSLADIVFLNMTERGEEIATLLAVGWSTTTVRTLFAVEGLLVTIAGSLLGAAAGAAFVVSSFAVSAGSVLLGALIAATSGVAVTAIAILIPLSQVSRRGPATQLVAVE